MTITELIKKLKEIKQKGFIETERAGATGVGYTFESLLGLTENNIAIADIGARIEIKTARKTSDSLITLFTFNRGVWKIKQKEIINKYGYYDVSGRKALKETLYYRGSTTRLFLSLDEENNYVNIMDFENNIIGTYDLYTIVGRFYQKLGRVLFCLANVKKENDIEYFHFDEFYLLSGTSPRKFIKAFKNGYVAIDLRMHLKENGTVRNRGTAFRIKEKNFTVLYENIEKLPV
jgi:hypothetical protein